MSPELAQFYIDLQEWVSNGCPEGNPHNFDPEVGICNNLFYWAATDKKRVKILSDLKCSLRKQFTTAGLDEIYPFYAGDSCDRNLRYRVEYLSGTVYKNLARLVWIAKKAREARDHA